jgi:hypothetical protein
MIRTAVVLPADESMSEPEARGPEDYDRPPEWLADSLACAASRMGALTAP